MCGIAGKLSFDGRAVEPELVGRMTALLEHRGPDDRGHYTKGPIGLGSTRLSILDPENGRMPLSNEDGTVWITYNGEVYNFQKLRARLLRSGHRFATRSDTETIVHLYEDRGVDCVPSLNGMFALAVWDEKRERLLLARDRMGVKPLYYARLGDGLVFASEMKALFAAGVERRVDRIALHDYLSLNYVPGPRTMVEGVRKLPPGHLLVARPSNGWMEVRRYWDFPLSTARSRTLPIRELEEALLERLRDAVRDATVSDVPVGAFLSGGVDSSLVVALMSELSSRPVKTFSVGFEESSYDEAPYARKVAERFGTDHHEIVLSPRLGDVMDALTEHFDEPFADNSAVAVFAVSELASRHVKVVLSGDGGDEVFGGYTTYQADQLARMYRRLPRFLARGLLPGWVDRLPTSFQKASFDFKLKRFIHGAGLPPLPAHHFWKTYLSEEWKARLYNGNGNGNGHRSNGHALRPTEEVFREHFEAYPSPDLVNRFLYLDSKVQLADCMLTKVDRMSMAHSLEVRVPLLDERLIELMCRLPGHLKVRGFRLKYLLKRVARRLLPREIVDRPKAGFTIPISPWLAGDLRDRLRDELHPSRVAAQGFFDPKLVETMIGDHVGRRRDHGRSLWTLWMFTRWHDRYLEGR